MIFDLSWLVPPPRLTSPGPQDKVVGQLQILLLYFAAIQLTRLSCGGTRIKFNRNLSGKTG